MGSKKRNEINIGITTGSRQQGYLDGQPYMIPIIKNFSYSMSGITRYHNCLLYLAGISGVARDLMDWLTTKMDNDNIVFSNAVTRRAFIKFVKDAVETTKDEDFAYKVPSERTVKDAYRKLIERGMLLYQERGAYQVNPEYFMNNRNEKSREHLIRLVLEFKYGKDTKLTVETDKNL